MDVFERVREVNVGVTLADERIAAARSTLLRSVDAGSVAVRRRAARKPVLVVAGVLAGVAAATATVIAVSQLTTPAPTVEAVPAPTSSVDPRQPGEMLPHPAPTGGTGVTEPFPGTTPQAGQYLEIQTTDDRILYQGPGGPEVYEWSYRPEGAAPTTAARYRSHSTIYVPGDRSGGWVMQYGPSDERLDAYPADQAGFWDGTRPYRGDIQTATYAGGIGGETLPLSGSDEWYEQYPSDPQALLAWFREKALGWGSPSDAADEVAVSSVIDVLVENYAPAATRSTFLQALAISGNAEVVATEGDVVTYRSRFTQMSDPTTVTVSVDTKTGWVAEYTSRADRAEGGPVSALVPQDVPDIRKTMTTTIVDALP